MGNEESFKLLLKEIFGLEVLHCETTPNHVSAETEVLLKVVVPHNVLLSAFDYKKELIEKLGGAAIEAAKTQAPSIQCPECEAVSYHPKDVEERYCGNCHKFHDEMNITSQRFALLELE